MSEPRQWSQKNENQPNLNLTTTLQLDEAFATVIVFPERVAPHPLKESNVYPKEGLIVMRAVPPAATFCDAGVTVPRPAPTEAVIVY